MTLFKLFQLIIIFSLSGCLDETRMQDPEPLASMTEHTKLTYSSETRSQISDYVKVLRKRFEPEFGLLTMENYQVDRALSLDDIVAHYQEAFAAHGKWTTVDAQLLGWSGQSAAAGWKNGDRLFLVVTVTPVNESDFMPVQTLSNLAFGD